MPNINKNPQAVNQKGYNGFPMSSTLDMTNTTGFLMPVHFDFLYSGDKITFKPSLRTRTNPLAAPASAQISENIDTFFVPINQLYSIFGDWYNNIKDLKTDFLEAVVGSSPTKTLRQTLPIFRPIDYVVYNISNQWSNRKNLNYAASSNYMSSLRLLDALGFPIGKWFDRFNSIVGDIAADKEPQSLTQDLQNAFSVYNPGVHPFFLAAYQKIYFDYYRLDDRVENNPAYYNLDSYSITSENTTVNNRANFYTTVHNVPWKRDYFRNVFVSPSVSPNDKNIYGISAQQMINNWIGSSDLNLNNGEGQSTLEFDGSMYSPFVSPQAEYIPNFTAFNVRSLFAVTKMLEVTRRAGKHYDKQTLAHLGVNVPMGIAGEVFELGHHEQLLQIGDVISTTNTYNAADGTGSPLGELAGKGYSGNGTIRVSDEINFTAPCEGILMSIYYARPEAVYNQDGLPKLLTKVSYSDFWHPEVDNLGMQPKFLYEVTQENSTFQGRFYGWEYAFTESKVKYNRAIGDVSKYGSKSYWTLTSNLPTSPDNSQFVVGPAALNSIMLYPYQVLADIFTSKTEGNSVVYNIDYKRIYNSDPLINHFEFKYNKASKMSTYSLLNL